MTKHGIQVSWRTIRPALSDEMSLNVRKTVEFLLLSFCFDARELINIDLLNDQRSD